METWMMFKNHYGMKLPRPNLKKKGFRDRRMDLLKTEKEDHAAEKLVLRARYRRSKQADFYSPKAYALAILYIGTILLIIYALFGG